MSRCIPICKALEKFTGVHCHTSYHHVDLRVSSTSRDTKDYETYFQWLQLHSPFLYEEHDSLICVVSGAVAGKYVNADQAFALGTKAASGITSQTYAGINLSGMTE